METPYPSQNALSSSDSSTAPNASSSTSTSACLSAGTSSSIIDEPRKQKKHRSGSDHSQEEGETGVSQRENEYDASTIEEGSSARPRTILRRSRTSTQAERNRNMESRNELARLHATRLSELSTESSYPITSASLTPPISRNTLRELDLQEVMRNAQLRHDVVFDPNLMFRPNFDGERGERKRIAAEQYWTAVSREISFGCRCSTFIDCELLPCICTNGSGSSTFTVSPSRLPTRITPLVVELRGILLSLLPATLPNSPTPPSTAVFGSPSQSNIPLPVYGPREQLIDALNPVLITRQLVDGSLDVAGLARFLGATLKTHCAPMRDTLVDEMVETAEGFDGVVNGLRMCFEILELMKLDIANHQLRSLRPYLLQSSVEFERRFFDGVYARPGDSAIMPRTQAWLQSTLSSIAYSDMDLPENPSTLVNQIVAHGVLDLVFSPPPSPSTLLGSPSRVRQSSFSSLPETLQFDSFRLAHFHCDVTDLTIVYMLTLLYQQLAAPARPSPCDIDLVRHELWCIISSNTGSLPSLVDTPASVIGNPSGPAGQGANKLEDETWRTAMQDALFQVAARAQQSKLALSSPSSSSSTTSPPTPNRQLLSVVQGYFDVNARADSKVFTLLSARLRQTLEVYVNEELEREKKRSDHEFLGWWTNTSGPVTMRTGHRRVPLAQGGGGSTSTAPSSNLMASASHRGTKRSHSEDDVEDLDSEDEREKRQKLTRSSSISIRHPQLSCFDSSLSRNGLASLSNEIKLLGDRIAKVTSFNLSVFRPLYLSLLSDSESMSLDR
ncbi:Sok1p [Sporobolomyces salmoneus]|uniref:Sok1p n=1 Tax=Sporobolomyces salmoneus TaxID=183962 RepID=UPI003172C620